MTSNLVLVEDGNKTKLTIERELIRLCYKNLIQDKG